MTEQVSHPAHYGGEDNPFEVIKVLEAWLTPEEFRGALKFNIIKYTARATKKGGTKDLEKARWYADYLVTFEKRRELHIHYKGKPRDENQMEDPKSLNEQRLDLNRQIDDYFAQRELNANAIRAAEKAQKEAAKPKEPIATLLIDESIKVLDEKLGTIVLARWPHGYVLCVGGEIVWKSFEGAHTILSNAEREVLELRRQLDTAVAAIESLHTDAEVEIARLKDALWPFARCAGRFFGWPDKLLSAVVCEDNVKDFTVADIRRAAAVLAPVKGDDLDKWVVEAVVPGASEAPVPGAPVPPWEGKKCWFCGDTLSFKTDGPGTVWQDNRLRPFPIYSHLKCKEATERPG